MRLQTNVKIINKPDAVSQTRAIKNANLDQVGKGFHGRRASSNAKSDSVAFDGDVLSYDENEHVFCPVDCEEDHLHINDFHEDNLNTQPPSDVHNYQNLTEPTLPTPPCQESSPNETYDENFEQFIETLQALINHRRLESKMLLELFFVRLKKYQEEYLIEEDLIEKVMADLANDINCLFDRLDKVLHSSALVSRWKMGEQNDLESDLNVIEEIVDASTVKMLKKQEDIITEAAREKVDIFKMLKI